MTPVKNLAALPNGSEDTGYMNVPRPEYRAAAPSEPLTNSSAPGDATMTAPLPRTSVRVMVVINSNGYLTPLCSPGNLLRWCKAAWRAELG